ncbi:MAG TPA: protease HtpX [Bdellovibrionota bacterium]|nr:protease HtpX [Bdellovibrionota bacterium]
MNFAKRILTFVLVNLLVVATISIVLNVLGVRPYLTANGIDYNSLAIFCLVWGMGGAFISLALSRVLAKWTMGVQVIKSPANPDEAWLVGKVHEIARRANLDVMPEVGVYRSPDPNAFATGPTKNRSLVAVSTGLMEQLDKNSVEGVLAHEVAHIANGDMVTMTLVQGVVNAFVMFFARIIAFAISQNVKEESRPLVNMLTTIVLEIAFSFLAMFVVAYVSRHREFRADAGAANLSGRDKMVAALESLQRFVARPSHQDEENAQPALAAFKISGKSSSFLSLLSTHPPLAVRIERLKTGAY